MNYSRLIPAAAVLLALVSGTSRMSAETAPVAAATKVAQATKPAIPRFNVAFMDRTADPRVDFARYAFGQWQQDNPIPADKSRWGAFNELDLYNQTALKGILEVTATRPHEPGSVEQKVGDFYTAAMNTTAIDAAGLKPLEGDFARIAAIATPDDLARTLAYLHNAGIAGLFRVFVDADEKNSTMNALQTGQGGMSLPSRDYYFDEKYEKFRTAFVTHVAKMFELAGAKPETAAADAKTVFELEKALATHARTPVELRDSLANYNKMPTAQLAGLMPAFPFETYLAERGISGPAAAEIIVGQPKFYEGVQAALTAHPLTEWQVYLRYHALRAAAPQLAAPFEQENFNFYNHVLLGTPAQEPRWQRVARSTDDELGEALGQLYVAQYYPPEAKARMDAMINNLAIVMRERLQKLEWMTEPTRQKALAKFERFTSKVGHPDKWRDYGKVDIHRDGYFANVRATTEFEAKRRLARLGQPVDRSEWAMTPPTVNAYFDPTANNINFPAGILQPPFFDFTLDDAVNYGGIGAVIGHEITHGFDDQGRHYDAEGNLAEWWTPEDAAQFEARAKKVVDQFNGYEALPGQFVNGELTLGENIADLGGLSIAYEAFQRSQVGKERKIIDGLTPEQRFFISWAQVWRTNMRENALKQRLATDPHSPGNFRAIGPLVNLPEFYEAFGIKEGDPMWRKPEDRAKIW